MRLRRWGIWLMVCVVAKGGLAAQQKACVAPDAVPMTAHKDVCVEVHVYDVVEVADGTRFLDVCSPDTPDAQCTFTIVSLREDRREVGELEKYRNGDVQVRGIMQPMHGRNGMILSHARQFHGGPPKFKPNQKLLRGFSGDQSRPPVSDPNLRAQGGHRAFMNSKDQEKVAK